MTEKVSVVVCILNEEKRIEDCLILLSKNNPDEIIVVDGGSSDKSIEIARKYTNNIIESKNSNLTRDRQKGIDIASNDYIILIDADHRLEEDSLENMLNELKKYSFDAGQSQLKSYENLSWLNRAEEEQWELTHNIAGPRTMMGVAPAVYKKSIFNKVKFDDYITKTIDDTDFSYRLSLCPELTYGVLETKIAQLHESSLKSYMKKFKWYGIGDGEFCIKNPKRMLSMLFHLSVRYPVIYSMKSALKLKFSTIPFFILQGYVRFYFAVLTIVRFFLKK